MRFKQYNRAKLSIFPLSAQPLQFLENRRLKDHERTDLCCRRLHQWAISAYSTPFQESQLFSESKDSHAYALDDYRRMKLRFAIASDHRRDLRCQLQEGIFSAHDSDTAHVVMGRPWNGGRLLMRPETKPRGSTRRGTS